MSRPPARCGFRRVLLSQPVGRAQATVVAAMFLVVLTGCPQPDELPDSLEVALSGTERQVVASGTGPPGLADAAFAVCRKADPNDPNDAGPSGQTPQPGPYGGLLTGGILVRPPIDEQIFVVHLGDGGRMTRISENRHFLPEVYSADISVKPQWSSSAIPGLTYRSASFGLQVGDRMAIAVLVQVRAFGAFVGDAIIYAWGTTQGDRIDGMFGYLLDFSDGLGDRFLDSGGDQYPIYALRR
jgi:hypothetical protein